MTDLHQEVRRVSLLVVVEDLGRDLQNLVAVPGVVVLRVRGRGDGQRRALGPGLPPLLGGLLLDLGLALLHLQLAQADAERVRRNLERDTFIRPIPDSMTITRSNDNFYCGLLLTIVRQLLDSQSWRKSW